MKFVEEIEKLQNIKENKGKIVLARCGAFIVAIGKDAILLHKILKLKLTCFKVGVCKTGIPVTHTLKYADLIENIGYGYAIYDYDSKNKKFELKYTFEGKSNTESEKCIVCKNCENYKEHNSFDNIDIFDVLKQRKEEKNKQKRKIMNEVFLIDNIKTKINFNFMINSKSVSIVRFIIKTLDNQNIKLYLYDKYADFAYSKLKIEDLIFIYGKLYKDGVKCYKIKKLNK